ncbi:MAG: tetratricopeptide repeat protein, partial [Saprospiraceae bacterium]|nr:tetratricopeptide repeat protein [Saprospiraceae bacterium]
MKNVFLSIYFILFLFLNVFAQHSVKDDSSLTSNTEEFTKLLEVYNTLLRQNPNEAAKYLRKADSLSNVTQDIKSKMTLHFAKADYFIFTSKYDSVIYNYQQGYLIAKNHGNDHDRLTALVGLARGYSNKNEYVKSDSIAQIALKIAIKEPVDSLNLALIYGVLANKEYVEGNHLESLEFEQKSLRFNQTDTVSRIRTYLRIFGLHETRRDREKAKFYADEALALSQKIKDTNSLAQSHRNLGIAATEVKNYEEALSHFELSTSYFEQLGLKNELPNIFYYQARIYLETNESNKAIEKYNTALKEVEKEGDEMGTAYTLYELGKIYSSLKDYTKAESYFLQAKTKFEAMKMNPMRSYIQLRLSQMYAAQKDFKNAYSSHVEFKRLDDSVFNIEKTKNFSDLEEKYQNKEKQQEIDLLNAKNEIAQLEIDKQTNLRNYLILAAILLALLIAVIYNRYQLKNKANAKLKELDAVKTNFFTNISHEFRTPLTLILSPLQQLKKEELNKDALDNLDIIQQNATRLTDLTNQLLELSKLEAGSL